MAERQGRTLKHRRVTVWRTPQLCRPTCARFVLSDGLDEQRNCSNCNLHEHLEDASGESARHGRGRAMRDMRYMWSAMDSGLSTPLSTQPVRGVVFRFCTRCRKSTARAAGVGSAIGDEEDSLLLLLWMGREGRARFPGVWMRGEAR
jgi:hypothetical protein